MSIEDKSNPAKEQPFSPEEEDRSPQEAEEAALEGLNRIATEIEVEVEKGYEDIDKETEEINDPEKKEEAKAANEEIKDDADDAAQEMEGATDDGKEESADEKKARMFKEFKEDHKEFLKTYENLGADINNGEAGDNGDNLKKAALRMEEYDNLQRAAKELEIGEYFEEFTENLGLEEFKDRDNDTKKALYEERQLKLVEELDKKTKGPEMASKRAKYKEILDTEKDIYNMTDQSKIDAVNDYHRALGEMYQGSANLMKYNYLSTGIDDKDALIDHQHMPSVLTIEKMEHVSKILMKGIKNLDENEKRDLSKYMGTMDKITKKSAWVTNSIFFSAFAVLAIVFDEKRMDMAMEKFTRKKVWGPVRYSKNR